MSNLKCKETCKMYPFKCKECLTVLRKQMPRSVAIKFVGGGFYTNDNIKN